MRRMFSLCVSDGKGSLGGLNERGLLGEQYFILSPEAVHHEAVRSEWEGALLL